jgi:hypothetical protein
MHRIGDKRRDNKVRVRKSQEQKQMLLREFYHTLRQLRNPKSQSKKFDQLPLYTEATSQLLSQLVREIDFDELDLRVKPIWNKEKIKYLSEITGLSEAQIYKWQWDHINKQI